MELVIIIRILKFRQLLWSNIQVACKATLVGLIVMLWACSPPSSIEDHRAIQKMRDMRSLLSGYAWEHAGLYPPSLQVLGDEIKRLGWDYSSFSEWDKYYFVGNLRTNDPPNMPIIMEHPSDGDGGGTALMLNGRILLYRNLDQETIIRLITEPWEFVRDEFESEEDFKAFCDRIILHPPRGHQKPYPHSPIESGAGNCG